MKIYKVDEILSKLENCIEYKLPFSHIRLGDGGLKFIHALLYNEEENISIIAEKEGLPKERLKEIVELWSYYLNKADFIDTPEMYFDETFWPRLRKPKKPIRLETENKLRMWKYLYKKANIVNTNFCNPESNCLMILKRDKRKTLFDVMKNRKVCLITARPEIKQLFPNLDIIKIVGQWENQYQNSFKKVKKIIENTAKDYDFFMVSAGELGRIYSGIIKDNGGRSIDLGFVVDYWLDKSLHPRFHKFINIAISNNLQLVLTENGRKYQKYI